MKLQIPLLSDQLTYSTSKEHMSNSTKEITMVIDFIMTSIFTEFEKWVIEGVPKQQAKRFMEKQG